MFRLRRVNYVTCLIAVIGCSGVAWSQSKFAAAFDKFRRTGDRAVLYKELNGANHLGLDLRIEIPALLDVVSYSNDPVALDIARGEVCSLAFEHPLEVDVFRPALLVFERHLQEAESDERSVWGSSIVGLHAIFGFQPSSRVLALMFRMVDYKDTWSQSAALKALARVQPLPKEVKELFRSRITKQQGKISGPELLPTLVYALPDPDALEILTTSAESDDPKTQRIATQVLSRMSPIPQPAAEVFRRLQSRKDLDEDVKANVKAAIDRIENKIVPDDQK